jgi:hypothetical protein
MTAEIFPSAAAAAQPVESAPPAAPLADPSLAVDPAVEAAAPPPRSRSVWRIILPAAALLAAGAFVLVTLHKPKQHTEIYAPVTAPVAIADAQAAAAKAKASADAARAAATAAQQSAAKAPAGKGGAKE